jgi:hypothetical protein
MPVRVKKSHPALKHGGYAATVLAGESVYEFEKLRQDLIANFTADGALEEDIVADLAGRLWRKAKSRDVSSCGGCSTTL